MNPVERLDEEDRFAFVIERIQEILEAMGIEGADSEDILWAPEFYRERTIFEGANRFSQFASRFGVTLGAIPSTPNDGAFLSIEDFAREYLQDSFPRIPSVPIREEHWHWKETARRPPTEVEPRNYPICFVLAPARSGTTIFRAMLNVHDGLWAPGEMHFAQFETMGHRATDIAPPLLRYLPIPEIATRLDEPSSVTARRFRSWEREDRPIPSVFDTLFEANPDQLIVDKTPPYCESIRHLERIGEWFPNAKFIHLIRNPYDVIRSLVRIQLYKGPRARLGNGLNPYFVSEMSWFENHSNINNFLAKIPPQRQVQVRYEDVVSDTTDTLAGVCDFLERPFQPSMTDPYSAGSGRVVSGAGDMNIYRRSSVEVPVPCDAVYPLADRTTRLARAFGY